ncbi:hypothetical protein MKAN_05415 [Mycobacterium kansasii ATCC 12478]|uniref:Uncharacterized protein n=1 Tax=Mycobacterium kansasii ATCC 12478 TaxID=557599 RepID=U5WY15_MYCKA|nr:hypothetical protein MKAN_05415 [Mycobacterium kansasii ATCC 12478]
MQPMLINWHPVAAHTPGDHPTVTLCGWLLIPW